MELWHVMLATSITGGSAIALYGAHLICLWLEERGWLYYMHRSPTTSMASCFVALQRAIEPPARYIVEIRETRGHAAERDTLGRG